MGKYEDLKIEHARLEEKTNQLQNQVDSLMREKQKLEQNLMKLTANGALLAKELEDLHKKLREGTNDALGTSMELEKVREVLKKREQELDATNRRIKELSTGGSGILADLTEVARIMREKIQHAKHNVRIVVPRLNDLERHGFLGILESLPSLVVINVSTSVDPDAQAMLVAGLQEKRIQLIKYTAENEYGLVVDGEECVIALVDAKNPDVIIGGLFTNIIGLTSLFMDAIQVAFVKGTKVPLVHKMI